MPGTTSSALDLLDAVAAGSPPTKPCARWSSTGAGRAFSSGADLKDASGGETTPDGRPDVYRTLTERYHPIMRGDPRDAQAGARRRQWARPSGSAARSRCAAI